jgi:spore coat protein SA
VHICIVAPEQIPVPPVLGGSVEICIHSIARHLAKGHRVTIISKQHSSYSRETRKGKLTILRVAAGTSDIYLAGVLRALKGKRYDLIQVDNRPRYAAAIKRKMPGVPVSLFMHSLTFVTPPYSSIRTAAAHLAKVDLIIANSKSLAKKLGKMFPKARGKIKTVLLGVDVDRFRPPQSKELLSIRHQYGVNKGFKVLYIGRLIPKKGIDVLIKAVHRVRRTMPGTRLVIVGGEQRSGYKAKLKRQAKKLRVPTLFVGNIPHLKLQRIYWLGDCFVCPSQKHEAFGLVNVEAMASGLPVIASRNGGIKEIVKNGRNGQLVSKYHSSKAFAKAIKRLVVNRGLVRKMGKKARQDAVKRFGWNRTAQALLAIYRKY